MKFIMKYGDEYISEDDFLELCGYVKNDNETEDEFNDRIKELGNKSWSDLEELIKTLKK